MLEWLKGKVKQRLEAGQRVVVGKALGSHFAVLEQRKVGIPSIAERLANYVVDGDDQSALNDLKSRKSGMQGYVFGGSRGRFSQGLTGLLKLMPDDPELYARLATVYDIASDVGHPRMYSPLPGLQGGHGWLTAFLVEVSDAGQKNGQYFSTDLLAAMAVAQQADPAILVRGALIVLDPQRKSMFSRWLQPPYKYFRCLSGFPELVSRFPTVVQEALHQSDATARAYTLEALFTLGISTAPFLEDITALSVSGSKEVREKAAPLIQASLDSFRPFVEAIATSGSSDERFHAVRLLGRIDGNATRDFLASRLESEKSPRSWRHLRRFWPKVQILMWTLLRSIIFAYRPFQVLRQKLRWMMLY